MCGIAGIVSFSDAPPPRSNELQAMCDSIVHRGPDEEGLNITDGVALGMRRLSIIDLGGGSQPIYNEDHSILCVFNGEIYNYRELRKELESCGHIFTTQSDTEVIIHGYEEYGDQFPKRLNGMFAIAIHDTKRQRLILARDHIGIKPLYYSLFPNGTGLVFGSEIKVLLASNRLDKRLDLDSLGQFLSWEYVPAPRTLFKGITKLKPGHLLVVEKNSGTISDTEYWDIPAPGDLHLSDDEWQERVNDLLTTCVRRQLVSDVPLGAFLSGGVDSSLIVAAMKEAATFSIGFDDPSYSELRWSKKVADHLKVQHTTEVLAPDILELFHKLLHFMDDPIGDFSIFPTYLVSRCARKAVTVALSGDGGDELFGGYETFVANNRANQYGLLPRFIRGGIIEPALSLLKPRDAKKGLVNKAKRFVEGAALPPELGHCRWRLFLAETARHQLFTEDAAQQFEQGVDAHISSLFTRCRDRSPLDQCLYVDTKSYLADNILTKVDRMSMAVSLETRVPYLDPELVSLAFSIPPRLKVQGNTTKVLLKRVAARHIPKECVYRPKEGFSIPIKQWLKTSLKVLLDELLSERRIREQGIFAWETVDRLKQAHLSGRENNSHQLWSLIMFSAWQDKWMKG